MIPEKGTQEYIAYVISLAERRTLREGVLNEPRAYFDEITVQPERGRATQGNPGAFYNGEQFPVRITHMLGAVRFLDAVDNEVDDETNVNGIGLRMQFHDQFYMNPMFLPVPLWVNKNVAAAEPVAQGNSSWDFVRNGRPFVLSARDTLAVEVQLRDVLVPDEPVPVTIQFTGFGMLSKRPYILTSRIELDDLTTQTMQTTDLRNDGSEPIIVTDMALHVANELGSVNPEGDINRVRFNIRQVGNGTNAKWFSGPQVPAPLNLMQGTLAGLTTGRAVVHEFPGDGLLWEPGEGITVQVNNLSGEDDFSSVLVLGLAGYIMVQ